MTDQLTERQELVQDVIDCLVHRKPDVKERFKEELRKLLEQYKPKIVEINGIRHYS